MTLQELYREIGGSYERAISVLRVEKLVDKHIRKLTGNGIVDRVIAAKADMNPTELFESAHAMKGVCGNLGLTELADAASEIAEEFRPGNPRRFADSEVAERLDRIAEIYAHTAAGIRKYEQEA